MPSTKPVIVVGRPMIGRNQAMRPNRPRHKDATALPPPAEAAGTPMSGGPGKGGEDWIMGVAYNEASRELRLGGCNTSATLEPGRSRSGLAPDRNWKPRAAGLGRQLLVEPPEPRRRDRRKIASGRVPVAAIGRIGLRREQSPEEHESPRDEGELRGAKE